MAEKPNPFLAASQKRKNEQEAIVNPKTSTKEENKEIPKVEAKPVPKQETTPKTETKREKPEVPKTEKVESPKKASAETGKIGRPKGKPYSKISINIPDEYLEIVEIAAGINYKGNTSAYIVSLVEKDIKANGKVYEQIRNLAK